MKKRRLSANRPAGAMSSKVIKWQTFEALMRSIWQRPQASRSIFATPPRPREETSRVSAPSRFDRLERQRERGAPTQENSSFCAR